MSIKNRTELESTIRQVLGIEMLEYEDKNLLAYDNKTRSELKINLLDEALSYIVEISKS